PHLRATHRRAAHATVSRVPAAAGHTQAIGEATNDACPGALREAEQVLIRKLRFVVAGHCHYAPAIHGHTGGVYGSRRCFKSVDLLLYLLGEDIPHMEGHDDHPGVALPLLPRDRHRPAWYVV